jgi:hypothetical protein
MSEFIKSKHSETLNALVEMQEHMLYAARRSVLNSAERIIVDLEKQIDRLTRELEAAQRVIDMSGALADWINMAAPAMQNMMDAYERRVRSDCTPGQIGKKPWECAEYIAAKCAVDSKPVAVVIINAANN